ncbi:MAG: glycosyltransferase [Thermoplasmata archaeon]
MKVIPITKQCDVIHCVFDPNNKNNKIGFPNKIFEGMVSGRPVIATKGIFSGNIIEKNNMGIAIEYSKKSYRDAIIKLKDNPQLCEKLGKNALKAAIREYNWEKQEEKLVSVYEGMH